MAFETGTSSGIQDLLDKLRIFALANGFTVNRFAEWAAPSGRFNLNLERGGKFFNLEGDTNTDSIYMSLSTGYADVEFGNQVEDSRNNALVQTNEIPGPYPTYWFFWDGNSLHFPIESQTGVYRHMSLGEIIKHGSYVGGEYICGHYWQETYAGRSGRHSILFSDYHSNNTSARGGVIRADHSGLSPNWAIFGQTSSGAPGNQAVGDIWGFTNTQPLTDTPNAINQVVPMFPVTCYVNDTTGQMYPIGEVSNIRAFNISNLNPEEQVLTTWIMLPVCAKDGPTGTYNSQDFGIAYDTSV